MTGVAAVTGAAGFLGRRLAPALAARGWRPRVLVRRPPPPGLWGETAVEVVVGALEDAGAMRALAEGADGLIHCAGLIKARSRADFLAANGRGADAAARAVGAGRMILVSSLAARAPALSDYAASKRAGEDAARAVLGERLIVMRPPAIYGPGDRETLGLFRLARISPVMPLPGAPAARLALAHVDDVAASLIERLEGAWTPGTYAIGGARPEGYGWREIVSAAAAAVGRAPVLAPTPAWLIGAAGALAELAARARGAPAIFNRGKARELAHPDWSVAEAEQAPDRRATHRTLGDGFADTVAWYRREGWLD